MQNANWPNGAHFMRLQGGGRSQAFSPCCQEPLKALKGLQGQGSSFQLSHWDGLVYACPAWSCNRCQNVHGRMCSRLCGMKSLLFALVEDSRVLLSNGSVVLAQFSAILKVTTIGDKIITYYNSKRIRSCKKRECFTAIHSRTTQRGKLQS